MIPRFRRHLLASWLALCLALFNTAAESSDWSVKTLDKEPPAELDPGFRALLAPRALQIARGGAVVYEFWFVRELPLSGKPASPAKALEAIRQTTPMGAVVVPADHRDYRDKELFADAYTARFGLQPQDGDHLGTSDYVFFLVLIPAKLDRSPTGITEYKPMVKASGKDAPSGHPVILSLRPVEAATGELPSVTEPAANHTAVRIRLPARTTGTDEAPSPVVFDLVCEGHVNH